MTSAQRTDDDVDRVGKLGSEFLAPSSAQDPQPQKRPERAAEQGDACRVKNVAVHQHHPGEGERGEYGDINAKSADTDRKARLQDQAVQHLQRQAQIAVAGQSTLAAKLHQHAFAIGLTFHQIKPPVDALAIGGVGEEQQIDRLDEQDRRERREGIEHILAVDVERHGAHSGWLGSK